MNNITMDFPTIVLVAAAVVAVICIGLALATPKGREAFASLGLRIGEALIERLIGQVSETRRQAWAARMLPRAVEALPPPARDKVLLRVVVSDRQ